MRRFAFVCFIAALAMMMCSCGSSNPSVLTYVERPFTTGNPTLYTLNTSNNTATAVSITLPTDAYYIIASPDGKTVAYMQNDSTTGAGELYVAPVGGNATKLVTMNGSGAFPSFSPDGKTIAYSDQDALYTIGVDGSNKKQVFADTAGDYAPVFSPDGKTLAFYRQSISLALTAHANTKFAGNAQRSSEATANPFRKSLVRPNVSTTSTPSGIYAVPVAGGTPTLVYASTTIWGPPIYSLDGKKILFSESDSTAGTINIAAVNTDGSGHAFLVTSTNTVMNPVPFRDRVFYNTISTDSTTGTQTCTINVMNLDGSGQATVSTSTTAFDVLRDYMFI